MNQNKPGSAPRAPGLFPSRPLTRLMVLALFGLAAGCGSGSGGSNYSEPSDPEDPEDPGDGGNGNNGGSTLEANFQSIQDNVFTPICTDCHIGASAPQGLRLDEANSYGLLVGVASAQQPSLDRVDPGNPDDSYLIHKLEGTAAIGGRMPLDRDPLPQADIDVIRQWISDGALQNSGETPTEPIRVTSLSPLPDSTIARLPDSVIAIFDRELDATSVSEQTFLLDRSGGDGSFDDDNEVEIEPASVSVPDENPTTAVLDLDGVDPVEDTYRVRLIGGGDEPAAILDLDSNRLDGEFDGEFPSGDGEQGGNFVAEFVVEGTQPTLESIQANVFTPICSACHDGSSEDALPGSMDLSSAEASHANIVDVDSVQASELKRVEPGAPDDSYLVHKIEGADNIEGDRMPLGQDPLDEETIAAIRDWIADGALE